MPRGVTYCRLSAPMHHSRAAATRLQPPARRRLTCRPRALPVRVPLHLQRVVTWPWQPLRRLTRPLGLHGKVEPSISGCSSSQPPYNPMAWLDMLVPGCNLTVNVQLWSAVRPQHVLRRGCEVRAHAPAVGRPSAQPPPGPAVPPLRPATRQVAKLLASAFAAHPPATSSRAHVNTPPTS